MLLPFGKPGLPPNWSPASKQGIGTACNDQSKVWFTLATGVVTEIFYPTIDTANTRDLQFLISDGKTFLDEERGIPSPLLNISIQRPSPTGWSIRQRTDVTG